MPLVFNQPASLIAKALGVKRFDDVRMVIITKAANNTVYVVIIFKDATGFKWARKSYVKMMMIVQAALIQLSKEKSI